ncbi:MAG TPA: isocitrate lyase/PEP mutase family protein [Ktedonobacterales bacterium]|jgi:2-methylisocitrate lyase-like PEP mutase family enzyme|nr:isocitrate lyase/PEP mutase family protein [Ktedonobacterales bacterium]
MGVLADHSTLNGAAMLRELLARPAPTLAPGAFDALSARVVESAGFDAVYMTGFGSSASLLGQPDVGLLTETEMMENARRMAQAISVPLIADADTGYGNPLNVIRTVRDYERAGIAALHIEDQVSPKKCGHMDRKRVIPADEMVAKIRAAAEARSDNGIVIIARTDARAMEGLDAAIARAERYRDAGADVLFVEAPQSMDEIKQVARRLEGSTLLFNWAEGGKTPPVAIDDLTSLGFKLIIFPISLLLAATQAMQAAAAMIRRDGSPINLTPTLPSFKQFTDFVGLPEVKAVESRYGVQEW